MPQSGMNLVDRSQVKGELSLLESIAVVDSSKGFIVEEGVADVPRPQQRSRRPQTLHCVQLGRPKGWVSHFVKNIESKHSFRTLCIRE